MLLDDRIVFFAVPPNVARISHLDINRHHRPMDRRSRVVQSLRSTVLCAEATGGDEPMSVCVDVLSAALLSLPVFGAIGVDRSMVDRLWATDRNLPCSELREGRQGSTSNVLAGLHCDGLSPIVLNASDLVRARQSKILSASMTAARTSQRLDGDSAISSVIWAIIDMVPGASLFGRDRR